MSSYTNSETVTYNDDGTITTKVEYTQRPATKKEQAAAWAGLIGITAVCCSPLIYEWSVELREKRKLKKMEKANEKAAKKATENN